MTKTSKIPFTARLHDDADTADIRDADGKEVALCYLPDATFIVRAVNSHHALVEALELALPRLNRHLASDKQIAQMTEALKLAKGS